MIKSIALGLLSWLVSLWLLFGLAACAPREADANPPSAATSPAAAESLAIEPRMPKSYALGIVGYNYTDRYIDSFEVDGRGGGNLDISTPESGGGKVACCYSFTDSFPLPMAVQVAWVGGYCRQTIKGWESEFQTYTQPIWKVATAHLQGPVPAKPMNMEVHIYRDDHVEVAITEHSSAPRLKLPAPPNGYLRPGVVVNDPVCPPDYDRAFALDVAMAAFKKAQQAKKP